MVTWQMRLKVVPQQIICKKWYICPKTITQTWLKLRCWINGLTHSSISISHNLKFHFYSFFTIFSKLWTLQVKYPPELATVLSTKTNTGIECFPKKSTHFFYFFWWDNVFCPIWMQPWYIQTISVGKTKFFNLWKGPQSAFRSWPNCLNSLLSFANMTFLDSRHKREENQCGIIVLATSQKKLSLADIFM